MTKEADEIVQSTIWWYDWLTLDELATLPYALHRIAEAVAAFKKKRDGL